MQPDERHKRYASLFGNEPATDDAIEQIESLLDITLPNDFKGISSYYSGGIVGGISHYVMAISGSANNIGEETMKLRAAVDLPHSMVALAEPPGSLIVLDTNNQTGSAAVIWLDATDVRGLNNIATLHRPQIWPSYAEFFDFLLDRELEERDEAN